MRVSNEGSPRPRVARAQGIARPSFFSFFSLHSTSAESCWRGWADGPQLRALMILPSSLVISQGWGLIDLLLRAFNEGLLRPRVARAWKIIRLHPFLFIVRVLRARRTIWSLHPHLSLIFPPPCRGGTGALAGHPCLLQLRPSNEALPRARVPGARSNVGVLPLFRSCISFFHPRTIRFPCNPLAF